MDKVLEEEETHGGPLELSGQEKATWVGHHEASGDPRTSFHL